MSQAPAVKAPRYVQGMDNVNVSTVTEALMPLYRLREEALYAPLRVQTTISICLLEDLLEMLLRCDNHCVSFPDRARVLQERVRVVMANSSNLSLVKKGLTELLERVDPSGDGSFERLE